MIPDRQEQDADPNRPDSKWRRLYRYGGICSLIMVAIVPIQIVVFVVSPPPQTVEGWFKLFQESALLGLLSFELLFLLYGILSVPLSLSLYFALRRTNPPIAILYIALSMLSVVAVFTARPAFEMLHHEISIRIIHDNLQRGNPCSQSGTVQPSPCAMYWDPSPV